MHPPERTCPHVSCIAKRNTSSISLLRSMSWRRLPSYLANIRLRLMPFNEQQIKAYEETGHVKQIAFKTTPRVGKVGGLPTS